MLDNAFVIVDYPGGARALLDLCMFAEATHHQEEMSVVGAAGKVEALIPDNTIRVGRRGEHWIGGVESYRVEDPAIAHEGLHHGSSYLEHLHFLDAIRTGRPARGHARGRAVVRRHGRRRPPQHRARPPGRAVRAAARPRPTRPAAASTDPTTTTSRRPSHEHHVRRPDRRDVLVQRPVRRRLRVPRPARPALASSFEHCRNIVLTADRYGYDNVLLPSGYALGIDNAAFAAAMAPMTSLRMLLADPLRRDRRARSSPASWRRSTR